MTIAYPASGQDTNRVLTRSIHIICGSVGNRPDPITLAVTGQLPSILLLSAALALGISLLLRWHDYGRVKWDRFYHCILPSDRHLIGFIRDLGLEAKLHWTRTLTGFYVDRTFHSMSGGPDYFVHESAYVDQPCVIGKHTKIWHFSHVMRDSTIGEHCSIGQNVVASPGCRIGTNVRIQNNVSVYTGVMLEDDVFCGPSAVFTNVVNPRAPPLGRSPSPSTRN
jgi:acetyltransferase-like isoleucine patch superfamily enzyme